MLDVLVARSRRTAYTVLDNAFNEERMAASLRTVEAVWVISATAFLIINMLLITTADSVMVVEDERIANNMRCAVAPNDSAPDAIRIIIRRRTAEAVRLKTAEPRRRACRIRFEIGVIVIDEAAIFIMSPIRPDTATRFSVADDARIAIKSL